MCDTRIRNVDKWSRADSDDGGKVKFGELESRFYWRVRTNFCAIKVGECVNLKTNEMGVAEFYLLQNETNIIIIIIINDGVQ